MRIVIDPLAQLVKRAERRINFHCTVTAQDAAHDRKRQLAHAVASGQLPSAEFARAAEIEGLTPAALAAVILAKPDVLIARDNDRRALVVRVRAAKTAAEIAAILAGAAIPPHPADHVPGLL